MTMLQGKRIVITGGSMGIGLAVAKCCAKEGASLTIISRNEKDLAKVVSELECSKGQVHNYHRLDVSRSDDVKKCAQILDDKYNVIDGLVNCAGIYGPIGKIDDIDPEAFVSTININFMGTFYMCHYFIPLLKKAKRSKIVNFSGGGAASPFPNYSAYASSKAAVVRFTENIAQELIKDNIDVNAVAPGFVVTRLHQQTLSVGENAGKEFLSKTMDVLKDGGVPPEKAAELIVFLMSSGSDGITGKFISAPWDNWKDESFSNKLRTDIDFATLRRIDDKNFKRN